MKIRVTRFDGLDWLARLVILQSTPGLAKTTSENIQNRNMHNIALYGQSAQCGKCTLQMFASNDTSHPEMGVPGC